MDRTISSNKQEILLYKISRPGECEVGNAEEMGGKTGRSLCPVRKRPPIWPAPGELLRAYYEKDFYRLALTLKEREDYCLWNSGPYFDFRVLEQRLPTTGSNGASSLRQRFIEVNAWNLGGRFKTALQPGVEWSSYCTLLIYTTACHATIWNQTNQGRRSVMEFLHSETVYQISTGW